MAKLTSNGVTIEGTPEELAVIMERFSTKVDAVEAEENDVEPLEVGDYAVVIDDNFYGSGESHGIELGALVKVTGIESYGRQKYAAKSDAKIHKIRYFTESDLRKATEAEVAQAEADAIERKRTEVFTSNGRKANEYREGDIVQIVADNSGSVNEVGDIGVVTDAGSVDVRVHVSGNSKLGNLSIIEDIEPLVFAESRLDRK